MSTQRGPNVTFVWKARIFCFNSFFHIHELHLVCFLVIHCGIVIHFFCSGKPYLICTFKDLIASVLQEDSLNFESDPQKKTFLECSFEPTRILEDPPDNQMILQYFAALFAKRITVRLTPLPVCS